MYLYCCASLLSTFEYLRAWTLPEIAYDKGVLHLSYFPVDGDGGVESLQEKLKSLAFKFEIKIAKASAVQGVLHGEI